MVLREFTRRKDNKEPKNRFWDAKELFSKEPFNSRLRTHKLTGEA